MCVLVFIIFIYIKNWIIIIKQKSEYKSIEDKIKIHSSTLIPHHKCKCALYHVYPFKIFLHDVLGTNVYILCMCVTKSIITCIFAYIAFKLNNMHWTDLHVQYTVIYLIIIFIAPLYLYAIFGPGVAFCGRFSQYGNPWV